MWKKLAGWELMTSKACAAGDTGGGYLVVSVLAHAMPWEGVGKDRFQD